MQGQDLDFNDMPPEQVQAYREQLVAMLRKAEDRLGVNRDTGNIWIVNTRSNQMEMVPRHRWKSYFSREPDMYRIAAPGEIEDQNEKIQQGRAIADEKRWCYRLLTRDEREALNIRGPEDVDLGLVRPIVKGRSEHDYVPIGELERRVAEAQEKEIGKRPRKAKEAA